jgi:hypothetical protein
MGRVSTGETPGEYPHDIKMIMPPMMHLGINLYILKLYPYHNERDITSNLDENRQASLEEELLNLIANQVRLSPYKLSVIFK